MNVTVYCSSHEDIDPKYKELARKVGQEIADAGDTLVFGGIRRGLMRIVAETAQAGGAQVIGVIPSSKRDLAASTHCERNDTNIYTDGINARKATMIDMADRFIILPGGYGTLDELLSTITTLTFEGITGKSITVYNPGSLYDATFRQIEIMQERRLLTAPLPEIITIDCD